MNQQVLPVAKTSKQTLSTKYFKVDFEKPTQTIEEANRALKNLGVAVENKEFSENEPEQE